MPNMTLLLPDSCMTALAVLLLASHEASRHDGEARPANRGGNRSLHHGDRRNRGERGREAWAEPCAWAGGMKDREVKGQGGQEGVQCLFHQQRAPAPWACPRNVFCVQQAVEC